MSYNHHLPKKIDLTPKRHHGFNVVLFIAGMLLPPIAVAFRFGIGTDFFINVILTICGYIPSHFHNFYIQNIRNNNNKTRTPKWASRYGLVDPAEAERKKQKSQWSGRYNERTSGSTHIDAPLEEGEEGDNYVPTREEDRERRRNEGLWTNDEEEYYNEDAEAPNQRHWHYPANFEGAVAKPDGRDGRDDIDGDRWERTRAAHESTAPRKASKKPSSKKASKYLAGTDPSAFHDANNDADVPEWGKDYGAGKKSKKSGGRQRSQTQSTARSSAYDDGPEDYERMPNGGGSAAGRQAAAPKRNGEPNWDHEF